MSLATRALAMAARRAVPAWCAAMVAVFYCGQSWGVEQDAGTAITDVSISNPAANEVWLYDTLHTLTCSTSTDSDRERPNSSAEWTPVNDSVSHYWTGSGTFVDNDNIGTSVQYISPFATGDDVIVVYADDDYAPETNNFVVDDARKSDTETVTVVGLEVHKVGFGGDHALQRTPTSEWDDGTTAITDPIWIKDDPDLAKTNHVCWTKGESDDTAKVKCRVSTALTEAASFQVGATGTATWTWADCSIASGATESSEATCEHTVAWVDKVRSGSFTCDWKFRSPTGANTQRNLNSSTHNVYLSYGTPAGSVVTVKWIAFVCGAADNESDLTTCANKVFGDLTGSFDLTGTIWGPDPVWLLHNAGEKAQCPGLALFVSKHFAMLGLGAGTIKYCHATAAGKYVAADASPGDIRRTIGAEHPGATTHDDHNTLENLIHWDGSTPPGNNRFEATCLLNGWHYALGVGKYNTAKGVVVAAFGTTINWNYVAIDAVGPPPTYKWANCAEAPWAEVP